MASTPEGRRLTEAYRLAQIRLGLEAALEARALPARLDPSDVAGTRTLWLVALLLLLRSYHERSITGAVSYLTEFRAVEGASRFAPLLVPRFQDARVAGRLNAVADRVDERMRAASRKAIDTDRLVADLAEFADRQVEGIVQQETLNGGRDLVDESVRAERVRYRRVTDGTPCAWCAMLAARGPVYSKETAFFRSHERCGCEPEPVYGLWRPTALELQWKTAYEDAAKQARKAGQPVVAPGGRNKRDTVLWRMRRNNPELFSDGIRPKSARAVA